MPSTPSVAPEDPVAEGAFVFDAEMAKEFLARLFAPLPTDSSVEIRTLSGVGRRWMTNLAEVNELDPSPTDRTWFGCAMRHKNATGGTAAHLTWLGFAFCDFDDVPDTATLIKRLRAGSDAPVPTLINESGPHGVHAFWKFGRLLDAREPSEAHRVTEISRGLAHVLGGDTKVFDVARVLGLPGSFNGKYSPPWKVRTAFYESANIYSVNGLEKYRGLAPVVHRTTDLSSLPAPDPTDDMPTLPRPNDDPLPPFRFSPRIMQFIEHGVPEGERSEANLAVVGALVRAKYSLQVLVNVFQRKAIGAKFRDKGSDGLRYLALTVQAALIPLPTIRVDGGVMKARDKDGAEHVIYTDVLVPVSQTVGDEVTWEVMVQGRQYSLGSEELASRSSLCRALPPVAAWQGTDANVQDLIPYFLSCNVPKRTAVSVVGWHGDRVIFPDAILGQDGIEEGSSFIYRGSFPASLSLVSEWDELATKIGTLLLQAHGQPVIYGLVGWFLATFAAPQLRGFMNEGFPLLNVWGATGAGKSSFLSMLWKLTGATTPLKSASKRGSSEFTKTVNLSASNTCPIIYDEHRANGKNEAFYEMLREAYQMSNHERGQRDLTIRHFKLVSRVVVSGESAVSDPALKQRALVINLMKEYLTPEVRAAFAQLSQLPLQHFAGGAYQHVRAKLGGLSLLWEATSRYARSLLPQESDNRKVFALIVPMIGLELFKEYLHVDMADAAETILSQLEVETANKNTTVDDIVIALFRLFTEFRLRDGVDIEVTKDNRLFVNPPTALGALESYFRREKPESPICARDAIRDALEHDTSGLVIVDGPKSGRIGGKVRHPITLDLDKIAVALGIPVEKWKASGFGERA